jgi:hypothetical protein
MVKLSNVYEIVKFNHVDVIGSKSDTDLKYFSDIDLEEFVKTKKTYSQVLKFFQDKFKEIRSSQDMYITDFKAGHYAGRALKWSYNDIQRGFKRFDNDLKITFESVLTQDSVIKLDLVVLLEDRYIEITTNYYFNFGNGKQTYSQLSTDDIKNKLLYNERELKATDYYKSLKRLYSYYSLTGNKKGQSELKELFNSDIGYLNKQLNSLKTISLLINNEKKPVKEKIVKAIYEINSHLTKYKLNLKKLDDKSFEEIDDVINKVIDVMSDIVDNETNKFIFKFDNIYKKRDRDVLYRTGRSGSGIS